MPEHLRWTPAGSGPDPAPGAELTGTIRWGEAEGPEPLLVHEISVPLGPVTLGELADDEPMLRLHSIRFGVRSWRELAGRDFTFPTVVREIEEEGESTPVFDIYGSLRLGEGYHEVVPSGVVFGAIDGCRVTVTITGQVRPVAPVPAFETTDFTCAATLTLGPVTVRGDLASSEVPDAAGAGELATRLLRVEDYRSPRPRRGVIVVEPDCGS
ncbi:hypothetical protein [Nakamurella sp.]|uniref:hypothetical protein n=1 Tax=Nakamurella sp. TaxID=1869182 RepID=UPI003B3B1530